MPKKKTVKKEQQMWNKFLVTMDFTYRLCGSVPQSKEIVRLWLDGRKPTKKPDDAKPIEEIEKEVIEELEQIEEKTTLGFMKDDIGLWVRGGTIKAHLKDCSNQIKDFVGIKNFRAKLANSVYIEEYKVYLRNGKRIVQQSCNSYEQPVHVITRQGPRNALKIINYVIKPTLKFNLMLLSEYKELDIEAVEKVFDYGSIHGYGGERGLGEGRYTFTIKEAV